MNKICKLSRVTKDYLTAFHCILDNMIHNMTNVELTDSISYNFIVQMIPHHQAAIEMSHNILKYTTCIPIQEIATQIIVEQTKSIENMKNVQCLCKSLRNSNQELCLHQNRMNQIIDTMFSEMKYACSTNQINKNFMWEMIPHHMGAIKMSNNTLQYDICPELIPILEAIIISQKKGIMQMEQLLQCIRN